MRDWRVLIVDGDPVSASLHRRVVDTHPGFVVGAVVASGEEAIGILRHRGQVDLILLDVAAPDIGLSRLLRSLRPGTAPDVIALTSVRDPEVVRANLHLGVVDYLVKPFPVERLRQALVAFRNRMNVLRGARLEQADIDALFASSSSAFLPKGVQADTLRAVRQVLQSSDGDQLTAEEVADRAAIARVTARRYLEYLSTVREVDVEAFSSGRGRPRKRYSRACVEC
jgi:two-component system response regulator DctR